MRLLCPEQQLDLEVRFYPVKKKKKKSYFHSYLQRFSYFALAKHSKSLGGQHLTLAPHQNSQDESECERTSSTHQINKHFPNGRSKLQEPSITHFYNMHLFEKKK